MGKLDLCVVGVTFSSIGVVEIISAGVYSKMLVKLRLMSASSKDFIARVDKVVWVFLGSFQDFKALSVAELAMGSSKGVDSADR